MSKCDIIMPVWDQLEVTRNCVDSILKHTTDHPYRLIIIDNGSQPPARDYLSGLKGAGALDILLIRNDKNMGFVKAVNQGMAASDAPYLCLMNNDTVATRGWLGEMIRVMEADPSIGLLNPSSNTSGQYSGESSIDEYAKTLISFAGLTQELSTCRGFCMLMTKEVKDKVGSFDEQYNIGYFEETDFCKRAQKLGYKIARAKAAYVYHKENVSFKTLKNNKELFNDNEKVFFKRWGRRVRVGYFVRSIINKDKIDDIATSVARNGHQINIFIKTKMNWPVTIDHFDIRRIDVNPLLFWPISIYKILKRKKKKKLEVLLTDNKLFGKMLDLTRPFHGSDVMVMPEKEDLLKLLDAKSKK